MRKIDPVLYDRIKTIVTALGCEFVGCEMVTQGQQMLFRIYIDKESGVGVEDCSMVSRQVSSWLDVEGPFQRRYVLEVSSPGIDRPLFERAHFEKYVGQHVKIKLAMLHDGRRQYKGVILAVHEDNIHLLPDETAEKVILSFAEIEKANVLGQLKL